jgi:23S rRNA U2552 (ribose-2'-O)-methylase RlmE/FtsJ
MPINSLIIAIDLVPMKPIPRVITLQAPTISRTREHTTAAANT